MSIVLGSAHFGMDFRVTVLGVCSLLFVIVSLLLLGFAIAYVLPPNIMSLITQVIMFVGLLFSPIIYAESRLPEWMSYIYNTLPFVPVSNIIRSSLFQLQDTISMNYVVVFCWGACSLLASMYVLRKRK